MSDADQQRSNYAYFTEISTRWMDNDIYGHINNVTYYSFFDTVANEFLIKEAQLDINSAEVVGYIVASSAQYHAPVAFPSRIEAGFRVNRLGTSSVEYGIAIFSDGQSSAVAHGTFTHVFFNRRENRSVPIPEPIRLALLTVLVET